MINVRMKKFICLIVIANCVLGFSSCGNNASDKSSSTTKSNSAQNIFEENCTACHGSDGKLCAMGAKDLSHSTLDKTQMMEIITNGKRTMTPFGTLLSKEEIEAVTEYVQTLRK